MYFFKTVFCVHVKETYLSTPLWNYTSWNFNRKHSLIMLGYLQLIGDQNLVTPSLIFSAIFLNA